MTRALQAERRPAAGGKTDSAVVFLHGYGADGRDLIGLADILGEHLPNTVFTAPHAPERCSINPGGLQWFPIPWIDGTSDDAAMRSMASSAADLDAYLDGVLEEEGLTADRMIVFGFSQGTMMALQVAPRRAEPVAGVVGFSGRLVAPELLEDEIVSRPPTILLHGDADDVVPPSSLPEATNALTAAGIDTYAHVMKGTGHGIDPDALNVALAFMMERLGLAQLG